MKTKDYLLAGLVTAVLSAGVSAQVTTKTNTGKILTEKLPTVEYDRKQESPQILLMDPVISGNKELTMRSRKLQVKLKAMDPDGIVTVYINKVSAARMDNNIYMSDVYLKNGLNEIVIDATDKKLNSSRLLFRVINNPADITYPAAKKSRINIIEPKTIAGKDLLMDEKSLAVRLKPEDADGIAKVIIGGRQAGSFAGGEYFSNVDLNDGLNTIPVKVIRDNGEEYTDTIRVFRRSDIKAPVITLLEPAASRGVKIVRKSEVLSVRGTAEDENGIYQVTVNDRIAQLDAKGNFSIDMNLLPGENRLEIKATDNKLNSSADTFYVTRTVQDMITTGKYYALLIGINSYSGYWNQLENGVNDARELGEVLSELYLFDSVIYLLDKDATRKNIINKLEWLANNTTRDDNVLIFYAGHGQFNKGLNKGYWVPVDATDNSVADYISNNDIKTFLGGIQSRHTFLITDACFAGDIFRGAKTESIQFDPNNLERYYREVYRKQSRLALTSGGIEEVMDQGRDGHSIFSYYLLKALRENQNKYLDASQLYQEFRIAVTNNSEQTPLLQVVRDTYDEGGQFIFVKK